jgi:hypothetical protein
MSIDTDCGGESTKRTPFGAPIIEDSAFIKPSIDGTLRERGNRYGPFTGHAFVTQSLKGVIRNHLFVFSKELSPSQQEAIDMILHKIGRIVNGDPNHIDSWHDIAGYATLVEKELQGEQL